MFYTRQLSRDAIIAQRLSHGGATDLARRPVAGGAVDQVRHGRRRLAGVGFDSAFATMVYVATGIDAPGDVHVARTDGSGERRLGDANGDLLREVALRRAERLQFASADGYAFDFKSQWLAASGCFVLKVDFRGSTGYGERFPWATWGAWGDKAGQDVMAGIDHVLARHPIDRARVATIGHSYGGFMSNWLITQYPDRFAAAIPGAGIVNWVSDHGTADIAVTKETEFFGTPWQDSARAIMIGQSPLT